MALGTLSIDIEARLARLEQGLEGAVRTNERMARSVEKAWADTGARVQTAFAAITAGLSAGAFLAFSRQLIDGVDKLNDLADATGSSVEKLSGLEDVARRTGASLDTVGDILVKFNKTLADAKPGSDAERALQALGLRAAELRRLDPSDALKAAADALAGFADDGNKARLVQELFGKSVKEAAPFLKDLADRLELVPTVTAEAAKRAEDFNKQLASLSKSAEDFGRATSTYALPALTAYLDKLNELARNPLSLDAIFGVLGTAAANTAPAKLLGLVNEQLDRMQLGAADASKEMERLQNLITGLENVQARDPGNGANNRRLDNLRAQLRAMQASAPTARETSARDLFGWGARGAPSLPDLAGGGMAKAAEAARHFEDYAMTVRAGLGKMAEDTNTVKLARLNEQLRVLGELAAAGLDPQIVREIQTALEGLATVEIPQDQIDRLDAINRLLSQTPTGQIESLRAMEEALAQAFSEGRIANLEKYNEAMAELEERVRKVQEQMDPAMKKQKDWAKGIEDTVLGGVGDTALAVLKGDFDKIDDLWVDLLQRMVAKAIEVDVGNAIFGRNDPGGLSQLFGLGNLFGGFFADGGTLGAGKWGIAGEKGPELIKGPAQVVPLRGAGGPQVDASVGTLNVGGGLSRGEVQAMINRGLAEQTRRLNRAMQQGLLG